MGKRRRNDLSFEGQDEWKSAWGITEYSSGIVRQHILRWDTGRAMLDLIQFFLDFSLNLIRLLKSVLLV